MSKSDRKRGPSDAHDPKRRTVAASTCATRNGRNASRNRRVFSRTTRSGNWTHTGRHVHPRSALPHRRRHVCRTAHPIALPRRQRKVIERSDRTRGLYISSPPPPCSLTGSGVRFRTPIIATGTLALQTLAIEFPSKSTVRTRVHVVRRLHSGRAYATVNLVARST